MAQCYHRQSCISAYWVITNPRPKLVGTFTFYVLYSCASAVYGCYPATSFCTPISNKLGLKMNRAKGPRGGRVRRQRDETWDNLEAKMAAKRTKADTLARSKAK